MTDDKPQPFVEAGSVDHRSSESRLENVVPDVFKTRLPENDVLKEVDRVIIDNDLNEYRELLTRGALLANNPDLIDTDGFNAQEKNAIKRETTHPIWSLSFRMVSAALTTSFAAVNFGMDESAVGGAQLQYNVQFGIEDVNLQGFVVAAPYLAAAVIGCPLTVVLNNKYGRKWVILLSCFIGFSGSLWQAFSNGLAALLIGRLYLGVGMGLNSATVPIYTAECSPAASRGAILMLWQTFIAFGVCLGSVFNRAFIEIDGSLSWRLMIGSSAVAPVICGALVSLPPESPRWLIGQNRVKDSLKSLLKLRSTHISGAKDFYILFESLKFENELKVEKTLIHQFLDLFTVRRNRFALWVSFLGIFGQQYGGVNILVNYTPTILTGAGVDPVTAIAGSIGIGGGCFLATFLSTQLIDRYGRRKMLIYTLPVEGICLFWLGGLLNVENDRSRLGAGLAAMYVFVFFYGWGIGPVSFTLVAETPALPVRAAHSAFLMAVNWLLCFCLGMTWPKMSSTMTSSGGLYFYGAWNFILAVLIYFHLPETKRYTLEELDEVFKIGASSFANNQLHKLRRIK